ncbi:Flavinator of succinate dehydrogenase-domain-containing protein [Mrakia frigida]|uniref:succinate dehydrogenase assembly factor SDH5 n=1 Tax=Mrakia frigida TaxID=29902 RepID=UPI003FCC1621
MSLRLISRRCSSLRTLPLATLSPSSSSVFLTLNRFKSSKDDVPETPRDPYPLPLSHPIAPDLDSTLAELTSFEIPPLDRSHEDMGTTRKRLVYQVRKRGMLEGDLLLATFARDKLPSMTDDEVREFDKLLDEPDWDIYYWMTYKKPVPARWENSALIEQLRVHTKNEGRVVRFMPALDDLPATTV